MQLLPGRNETLGPGVRVAFARPHADLPVGKTLSPSSPPSRPEPPELEERRHRGTDGPHSSRTFSEAREQSWEVVVLGPGRKPETGSQSHPWAERGLASQLPFHPAPSGSINGTSGGAEMGASWAQPAVPAWTRLGSRGVGLHCR